MVLKKKIVLITPGQPSVNPRVVKEAEALTDAGHDVTVLYSFWIDWAYEADKKILANAKWQYRLIGGTPQEQKWLYLLTRLQFKFANLLNKYFGNKYNIAEKSQARCFKQLLQAAKEINADWYIAHNLGALGVAVRAAKYHNAKAAFDFEDYHRAENKLMSRVEVSRITFLENKYIPSLHYTSTASPLITEEVKFNFPGFNKPLITVNNTFPKKDQPVFLSKKTDDKSLQLFWFSQTVGVGRGIEIIIDALKQLNDKTIFLTLIGRCPQSIQSSFLERAGEMADNICFKGVVNPDEIPVIAATMDIGLALEQTTPYNRNICLTNKIFTYLQAGNALILTNTLAQIKFQQQYNVGRLFDIEDIVGICTILKEYKNNAALLYDQRKKNWQLANESLNWENESSKILNIINA